MCFSTAVIFKKNIDIIVNTLSVTVIIVDKAG